MEKDACPNFISVVTKYSDQNHLREGQNLLFDLHCPWLREVRVGTQAVTQRQKLEELLVGAVSGSCPVHSF